MQIEKFSKNQIEVILTLEDLKKNNISLHSFMCNSLENHNLFFEILSFENNETGFNLNNYEIVIETFSIPAKGSFVLYITRIPKASKLHLSKNKFGKFKAFKSFWIKFNNFEDLCFFCNSLSENIKIKSSLYLLKNSYFLYIQIAHLKNLYKTLLTSREFSNYIFDQNFILDENAKTIIKDYAVEISKKFYV